MGEWVSEYQPAYLLIYPLTPARASAVRDLTVPPAFQEECKMRDEDKTREQLMGEVAELRRQVAELKAAKAERKGSQERRAVKIGEILIEMDYLTRSQLERSLQEQAEADKLGHKHKPLGAILVKSGIITDEQLRLGIKEQLKRFRHRVEE
jgi:hypothetical protein